MKKVLVGTCVLAMAAFGITNASSAPVSSARGAAYGINLELMGDSVLEPTPEVESVLGQGERSFQSDDIITPDVSPVTFTGAGVVVANTSVESTIRPFTFQGGEGFTEGDGGAGGAEGLLAGALDDILPGLVGGAVPDVPLGSVQAQQLGDTLGGGGDGGTLGGLIGGDLLGGILPGDESGDVGTDAEIEFPLVNALGFARITDINLVNEEGTDSILGPVADLPAEVQSLLIDALLQIDAVTAEAVAVCGNNGAVFFDTASNVLSVQEEPVSVLDDLLNSISDVTADLGLLEIATNEVVIDEATGTVGVNALRITLLDGGAGGLIGGEEDPTTDPTIPDPTIPDPTIPDPTIPPVTTGAGSFQTQQVPGVTGGGGDGDDPLLEVIIGHAEVSGTICAQQAAPPTPLPPAGDDRTLPVTGGGLGVLPAVLGLGLAGGALAAGRVALRSRREHTL